MVVDVLLIWKLCAGHVLRTKEGSWNCRSLRIALRRSHLLESYRGTSATHLYWRQLLLCADCEDALSP